MSSSEQDRQWQDLIVDHSQFPRRHGTLASATHRAEGENPLCGDKVRLYLAVDGDGRITDASFEATGCAISLASASILTDNIRGLSLDEAEALFEMVHSCLTGKVEAEFPEGSEIAALGLISRFPLRVKCASLSWHTLREALAGGTETVTTET